MRVTSARVGGRPLRVVLPAQAAQEYEQHLIDDLAITGFRAQLFALFDPERPQEDPNDLLRRMGGRVTDPNAMNHHCPLCDTTYNWQLFKAHLRDCYRRNRKVRLDITRRVFAGGSVADAQTGGLYRA
jgi:hypothetical protein